MARRKPGEGADPAHRRHLGPTYAVPHASASTDLTNVRVNRRGAVLICANTGDGSVVFADHPRGGDGSAVIMRRGVTGGWRSGGVVPTGAHWIEDAGIAVTPDGRETVALGYASPNWESTSDTEFYWATGYRILTQDESGRLGVAWKRDGAVSLDLTRRGSPVQATWRQRTNPENKMPTRVVLRTQRLEPTIGAQTTLAGQPASPSDNATGWLFVDYARVTALGPSGQVAAWSQRITESGTLADGIKLTASQVAAALLR